jgi:DNA mismatch endonuclease (patch repair protein)
MPDVLTKEQRSYNMSRIRSKNTKSEIKLRRLLRQKGIFSYRLHFEVNGKPDIVFPKKKIAVFVDGCFWHKCPIHFVEPHTRKDFWTKKIEANVLRDKKVNEQLKEEGWTVLRFWEHEVNEIPDEVISRILFNLS